MYQNFKQKWHKSAMEARDHSKNGANLKGHMSKVNLKMLAFLAFIGCALVFAGCEKTEENNNLARINDDVPTKLMASFAKATYNNDLYRDYEFPIQTCSNSEWKLAFSRQVGNWNPYISDFWYQIYENDNAIVIAFRGTPPLSWNPAVFDNWKETFGLITGNNHPQDDYVRTSVKTGAIKTYLEKAKTERKKIFLTGHSLGGHLAMIAYLEIRKNYEDLVGKVETFNAVGLQKGDADEIEKKGVDKIRQHYTCCDIANWGSQATILGLGKLYFPAVERPVKNITTNLNGSTHKHSTEENWWDFNKAGIGIDAHSIEYFVDDCNIRPDIGLTEDIYNIIPDDILEKFIELGIEINGGNNPPNVEGTYLISPLILVKSNFSDSYYPGYKFADMQLTFSRQDNTKLTVVCDYINGTQIGSGLGSFITGNGNKFSVFTEVSGTFSGYPFKSVEIYSGEITSSGIKNYYSAIMITQEAPGTIKRGQGRLIYDSDGFSERTTQNKSAPVLRSKLSSGVSIISSTQPNN